MTNVQHPTDSTQLTWLQQAESEFIKFLGTIYRSEMSQFQLEADCSDLKGPQSKQVLGELQDILSKGWNSRLGIKAKLMSQETAESFISEGYDGCFVLEEL